MTRRYKSIIFTIIAVLAAAALFRLGMEVGDPAARAGKAYHRLRVKLSYLLGQSEPGRWKKSGRRPPRAPEGSSIAKLRAFPYLQGKMRAPEVSDVSRYRKEKAYKGLNLVVSGHKPAAYIMDMEGRQLHEWSAEFGDVWPEGIDFGEHESHKTFWRRVHMYENGDILAIFEGIGIVKLDKDSNIIWSNKCRAHHDIYVGENGTIYVLAERDIEPSPEIAKKLGTRKPILEDFINVLGPDGELLRSVSLLDCFLNSDYAAALDLRRYDYDILHTNTLTMLGAADAGKAPFFKEGLFLISCLSNNTIALADIEAERVTWTMSGLWKAQHQPEILDSGNVMVFDNRGLGERSRVVEADPVSKKVVWSYAGSEEEPFYSETCGTNQRLPNGNTLITESDNGRAFEATPEGEIVWEYYNPHRAGENGELIAVLFEVLRLGPRDAPFISEGTK